VAVLGIDNAVQNRFAWEERRFITEEKYQQFKRYTVRPGDVIITIMGTTGRAAVVPEDIPLAISSKHLAVISVERSMVHPEFLAHAIHSDPTVLAQIAVANRGAIMSGLNLGIIKRLRVRLPPLALQEQFASFVTGVSKIHHQLTLAIDNAAKLFDSLAQRAFRGELEG
jgi:type I restriction enzyme S subunit